jgi:hypothetical protein
MKFAYHLLTYISYSKYIPQMKRSYGWWHKHSLLRAHFAECKMELDSSALLETLCVCSTDTAVDILMKQ